MVRHGGRWLKYKKKRGYKGKTSRDPRMKEYHNKKEMVNRFLMTKRRIVKLCRAMGKEGEIVSMKK